MKFYKKKYFSVTLIFHSFSGVFARKGLLQSERPHFQPGASPLLLHARLGLGALQKRHHKAAPQDREVPKASALFCFEVDIAKRSLLRFWSVFALIYHFSVLKRTKLSFYLRIS